MDPRSVLAESALFANLAPEALDRLASIARVRAVRSGEPLFSEGEPADQLYIVATGRLRAQRGDGTVIGFIGRLEPIGEVGMLSGEQRTATVRAIRDSVLIGIPRAPLMDFLTGYPSALIAITRILIQRLTQNQRQIRLQSAQSARSFAIVPATPDIDVRPLAEALLQRLSRYHSARRLDAEEVDAQLGDGHARAPDGEAHQSLTAWLNQLERRHRYLVYQGSPEPDAWSLRCMRQTDRVLVVTRAGMPALASPMVEALKHAAVLASVELIVERPEAAAAGEVSAWRAQLGARGHHYLRPGNAGDLDSLARQLTGRGIGLVLGGGGARGFAHIGLLRALEELQIPVDLAGGSSMGAFVAALYACGYNSHEMMHVARETFVSHNYLNDYLIPRIALIRGRKFVRRLHEVFGDRRIEDLRRPYFCVASNLTRGTQMVFDQGPLSMWLATSMCVPGIAPPVVWQGELLVDGAVVNSLPTDVMQLLERGPIIASDVSTEGDLRAPGMAGPDPEGLLRWKGPGEAPSLRDILFRTATLTSESGVQRRAQNADHYLRMPVGGIGMFDWKLMDEIVERGYRLARERFEPLRETLLR